MYLLRNLLIVLVLVACSQAEETELLAAAKGQISKLTVERDTALQKLAVAETDKAQALQAASANKKTIDDLTRKIQELEHGLKQEASKASKLEAQLSEARKAAATGSELQALLRQAQESWFPLWLQYRFLQVQEFVVGLLEDLKGGKHGPVGVKVHNFLDVAGQHATKTFVLLKPHVDKGYAAASLHASKAYAAAKPHVDEGLAKASVVLDKACVAVEAHWKKYVTEAEWLHELKATYAKVEQELIREVSKVLREMPALKPYSDPVTVQLLVYAIILVPVLVILVPALALGCSRPAAASKDAQKRGKQEKGKPGPHGKRPKRA